MEITLGFRWISWINLMISGAHLAIMFIVFKETRGSALLERRAIRLTKETGILHQSIEDEFKVKPTLTHLISKSVKRPFILLLTEPIVTAFSIYVATLWGCVVGPLHLMSYLCFLLTCLLVVVRRALSKLSSPAYDAFVVWLLPQSGLSLPNMAGTQ